MLGYILAFAIGIGSSLAATWLINGRQRLRFRLSLRAIRSMVEVLARRVEADSYVPDLIISIDRNGTIVGSILAACFGLRAPLSVSTENVRNKDGSRSIKISDPFLAGLSDLGGLRILVVICCNDTGTSLATVVSQVQIADAPPVEVRTCALYSSISPSQTPNYVGVVVGRDTKKSMNEILANLPWITPSWHYQLASERARKVD